MLVAAVAAVVFVPIAAAGLYAVLGSPGAASGGVAHASGAQVTTRTSTMSSASDSGTDKTVGSVASMLERLEKRLQDEPDDAGGWLLLAKSYDHLGRTDDAIAAYEKARALGKTDAKFEESMASAAPAELSAPKGPSLHGMVTLSGEAAALVKPDDTVFIFAKESIDQRMPVVALRKPATQFPLSFELTDRDAMIAGTSLTQFETLIVTAKISRSGLATEILSGLEAWSDPISPQGGDAIELQLTTETERSNASVGGNNE
jgi:hypothetical protein